MRQQKTFQNAKNEVLKQLDFSGEKPQRERRIELREMRNLRKMRTGTPCEIPPSVLLDLIDFVLIRLHDEDSSPTPGLEILDDPSFGYLDDGVSLTVYLKRERSFFSGIS